MLPYTRVMMAGLLFMPQPKTLAMIGLGGGSLPKYCHQHLADTHITVVEINPHIIALRDDFAIPPDSTRFQILCGDGANYVADQTGKLDMLMVDDFDKNGQAPSLCT